MVKKNMTLFVLLIFIGTALWIYYFKIYLKEDKLSIDIKNRLENNSINNLVTNYEILQQKDLNNLKIVLYRYTSNSTNLVDCAIYKKTYNKRYKFIKGQQPAIAMGTMMISSKNAYLIHFGYTDDTAPNKYEITLGDKTFIKEYNKNEPFIEPYSTNNGKVGITPIY